MKRFFLLVLIAGNWITVSCRRAAYECQCHYPDGMYEVYPLDPGKQKDRKEDCEHIKKDSGASDCDFVVNP